MAEKLDPPEKWPDRAVAYFDEKKGDQHERVFILPYEGEPKPKAVTRVTRKHNWTGPVQYK